MALHFIGLDSLPAYIALSGDISGSTISGASHIGKTVYITDTQTWYITTGSWVLSASALLLAPYIQPPVV